ncbi:unnamed protein product [Boreogadus saida]
MMWVAVVSPVAQVRWDGLRHIAQGDVVPMEVHKMMHHPNVDRLAYGVFSVETWRYFSVHQGHDHLTMPCTEAHDNLHVAAPLV